MARQHGMILALHFMKLLKSSKKFIHHITYQFDNLKSINCMKSIHQELLVNIDAMISIQVLTSFFPF